MIPNEMGSEKLVGKWLAYDITPILKDKELNAVENMLTSLEDGAITLEELTKLMPSGGQGLPSIRVELFPSGQMTMTMVQSMLPRMPITIEVVMKNNWKLEDGNFSTQTILDYVTARANIDEDVQIASDQLNTLKLQIPSIEAGVLQNVKDNPQMKGMNIVRLLYTSDNYFLTKSLEGNFILHKKEKATTMGLAPIMQLRSSSLPLSTNDIKDMLKKFDFYCREYPWNTDYANDTGKSKNDFQDNGDGTVTDGATGLMWQKGCSPDYCRWKDAQPYVDRLNIERFAGYDDWRLPTIEELSSLMDQKRANDGLYIDPVFSNRMWFWSSDPAAGGVTRADLPASELAWAINLCYGSLFPLEVYNAQNVRAVRKATIPPGRQFYLDHLAYLGRGDVDGLLRDHYHEDAEMVTFEFILKGHEAIKKYLTEDAPRVTGKILGVSLDYFAESDDVILYKASVKTEKFGTIKGDDAFYLKDGKILRHIALTISPKKTEEWAFKEP